MKLLHIPWIQGVLISILFTFIFCYSVVFNLASPIEAFHGDTFHVVLTLKHYMDVIFNNDWKNIFAMPMFYGFKDSLLFSELFIMQGIMALPIYILTKNILVTYNLLSLFTIFLSFFSMFIFVQYATKRFLPAVLAAIIYVFNPFVIGHFPDNLHYYSLEWIPLIFLFLEKSIKKPNSRDEFLVCFFLICQLLTTLTFGALLTVVLPVYVLIRIYQLKTIKKVSDIKKYITLGAIIGVLFFGITTVGISKTYDIHFQGQSFGRNLDETAVFSPWVYDLLLTSPNNLIYGWGREWSRENLSLFFFNNPEYIERNLFFGIGLWILIISSFFVLRKSKYRNVWIACMVCGFFSVILSFGPRIRFTQEFSIPGPYGLIHEFHPLLQNLRVASRFMVLAFFFFGLIAAFTLIEIEKYFNKKTGIIIALILILFITIEYSSVPWKFTPFTGELRNYYSFLDKQTDIDVIVELPMGNLFSMISHSGNQFVETQYMLFAATLHNKKILNGYSSYTPEEYPPRIEYLTVNFPTKIKIDELKKWGVDAISVHRKEFYSENQYIEVKKSLDSASYLEKIKETQNLILYKIKK